MSGVLGAVAGLAHIAWRASGWRVAAGGWVALGTSLVELVGVLAGALLTWAMWHRPVDAVAEPASPDDGPTAVMVVSAARELPWLRATVRAARELGPITIVDLARREDVRAFADEHELDLLVVEPGDLNGVAAFVERCAAETFVHLVAGDIPHPQLVARLRPHLRDPLVSVVQAIALQPSGEPGSDPRRPAHRHRDADRRALNPALGARGAAMYTGSGALVRTAAVRDIEVGTASPQMACARLTASVFASGGRIVAPGPEPLVSADALLLVDDIEDEAACEASAARELLLGEAGALRVRGGVALRHRLAMLAWSIRPLAGVRRSVLVCLVAAALLGGGAPFDVAALPVLALWAPWVLLSTVAVHLLSGGWIRPGDRSRAAFRALGTSWRGVGTPNGRPQPPRRVLAGAFGLHHSIGPTVAVVVLGVVLGLRGASDRFTHSLRPIGGGELAALLAVALWLLWSALDALRVLARRGQARRAKRVAASLPCTMLDHAALIVDLTPSGAGVLSDVDAEPGDRLRIDVVLPTSDGVTSARLPAVVRNVRLDFTGEHRIGVQFGEVDRFVAEALADHCLVQPGLAALGTAPEIDSSEIRPIVVVDVQSGGARRLGLRAAALVALAGAFASAVPPPSEAAAASVPVRGRVIVDGQPVAGAVALAVCSVADGPDARYGTADDRFLAPVSAATGDDGGYELEVSGGACWASVAMPRGVLVRTDAGEPAAATEPSAIDLSGDAASVIEAVRAPRTPGAVGVHEVIVHDHVFLDADADGRRARGEHGVAGVTVTTYDAAGLVLGRTVTDDLGAFAAPVPDGTPYRIGLSNVPADVLPADLLGVGEARLAATSPDATIGPALVPAAPPRAAGAALAPFGGALPEPVAADLADRVPAGIPSEVAAFILAIAGLLAISVLLGSLLPAREAGGPYGDDGGADRDAGGGTRGGWGSGQSSPDFAIR